MNAFAVNSAVLVVAQRVKSRKQTPSTFDALSLSSLSDKAHLGLAVNHCTCMPVDGGRGRTA
jgi:hypothetical protein